VDLLGLEDGQARVHVPVDAVALVATTLHSLLPRESASKECDAAQLASFGFPAFALRDRELAERLTEALVARLGGRYGLKRFLLDGHQCVLEDSGRLHYEPEELQRFAGVESEWPLFFANLALNAFLSGDAARGREWLLRLRAVTVEEQGLALVPELYYVPRAAIEAERALPGSQPRLPNENRPLLWAQSLYYLLELLDGGLIQLQDLDPLGRRSIPPMPKPKPGLLLVAGTPRVEQHLRRLGLEPISGAVLRQRVRIAPARALRQAWSGLGAEPRLKLTGRPPWALRPLASASLYHQDGADWLVEPELADRRAHYLAIDLEFLMRQVEAELAYCRRAWGYPEPPVWLLRVSEDWLADPALPALAGLVGRLQRREARGRLAGPALLAQARRIPFDNAPPLVEIEASPHEGWCIGLLLPLRRELVRPLEPADWADWAPDIGLEACLVRLAAEFNPYAQIECLRRLVELAGLDTALPVTPLWPSAAHSTPAVTPRLLLLELYDKAAGLGCWGVLRRAAELLGQVMPMLESALLDLLALQLRVAVGRGYTDAALLTQPESSEEIAARIRRFCGQDPRERMLHQELLVILGLLARTTPRQLRGILTLRVHHLLQLLVARTARRQGLALDMALEHLADLPPHVLFDELAAVLEDVALAERDSRRVEGLHAEGAGEGGLRLEAPGALGAAADFAGDWRHWRETRGAIGRLPDTLLPGVWQLLAHCHGLVVGDKYDPASRLDAGVVRAASTPNELSLALRLEQLLNRIAAPEYRQLCLEAIEALVALVRLNPRLRVADDLVLDVIIGHAVRLSWQKQGNRGAYEGQRGLAWAAFYDGSPPTVRQAVFDAVAWLLHEAETEGESEAKSENNDPGS